MESFHHVIYTFFCLHGILFSLLEELVPNNMPTFTAHRLFFEQEHTLPLFSDSVFAFSILRDKECKYVRIPTFPIRSSYIYKGLSMILSQLRVVTKSRNEHKYYNHDHNQQYNAFPLSNQGPESMYSSLSNKRHCTVFY